MWFHGPTSVQVVTPYNSGTVTHSSGVWRLRTGATKRFG